MNSQDFFFTENIFTAETQGRKDLAKGRTTTFLFGIPLRLSAFVILLLISIPSFSQISGLTPIEDVTAFKTQLKIESASIHTIASEFTQTKHLSFFSEDITTTGKFAFKKDNLVRWEYTDPFSYLIILNGEKVLIKDDEQASTFDAKSNEAFRQVNDVMVGLIGGQILDNKMFKARYFMNKSTYLVELVPTEPTMKEFLQKLYLYIDTAGMIVTKIEMFEAGEDKTTIEFFNHKLNGEMSDDLFRI
ncbi:outer membrane lipoprotein carrier protein LolA [bacterium]|nr:outer membrane lipoprotein carrier protein LolA [bacterium]